jgi:hypothetical protein
MNKKNVAAELRIFFYPTCCSSDQIGAEPTRQQILGYEKKHIVHSLNCVGF